MNQENDNSLEVIDNKVTQLSTLLEGSLTAIVEVSPIYREITKRILDMVNDPDELSAWDAKDLLKLLDLANKSQLEPLKKATELIHAIQSMRETSAMSEKMRELNDVVQAIKEKQDNLVEEAVSIEDVTEVKE